MSTFLSRHYLPADGCSHIRAGAVSLREHLLARLIQRRSGQEIAAESMERPAFLALADKHIPPHEAQLVGAAVDCHVCRELFKRWLRERDGELSFAERIVLLREVRACNRDLSRFLRELNLESDGVADAVDVWFREHKAGSNALPGRGRDGENKHDQQAVHDCNDSAGTILQGAE